MQTQTQTPVPPTGALLAADKLTPERPQICDFRTVGGIEKARLAPLVASMEVFARTGRDTERNLGLTVVVLDKCLQDPAELLLGDRVVAGGK
jgi:hypothetical protein